MRLDTGETRSYDALLVANGHHWKPRWPEPAFPGSETFAGEQLHAHSYVDNSIFEGKRVVVLGMGNSAMDIAVESSYVAERTYLAARSGVWILPKYVFGKPVDQMRNDPRVPFAIRQRMIQQLVKSYAGPPERYGLPKPTHRFGEAHPTVSGRILDRIQHGTITPKPNIEALRGRAGALRRRHASWTPTWSSTARATRSPSRSSTRTSSRPRTTTSSCSGASSIPTSQTSSSSGCCSRSGRSCRSPRPRGRGSGTTCAATTALPPNAELRADIAADQAAMRKRYVASKRHTIQVDFDDYLYALAKERAAGAERARQNGFQPPLECRASAVTAAS